MSPSSASRCSASDYGQRSPDTRTSRRVAVAYAGTPACRRPASGWDPPIAGQGASVRWGCRERAGGAEKPGKAGCGKDFGAEQSDEDGDLEAGGICGAGAAEQRAGERTWEGDEADGTGGVQYRDDRFHDAVAGDVAKGFAWRGADGQPGFDFVAATVDAIGEAAAGEGGRGHGAADDDPGDGHEGTHVTSEGGQPDD